MAVNLDHVIARIPPGWGSCLSIPEEWHDLIFQLDKDIAELVPDYELHQCKDKFGGLRYYIGFPYDPWDDEFVSISEQVDALIHAAEEKSYELDSWRS